VLFRSRLRNNPEVEVETGSRRGETSSTDFGLAFAQDLDLPARRQARLDVASAAIAQEEQHALQIERDVLCDVAVAFLRALEARERADSASRAKDLAVDALQIAQRRYAAGDVAQLDVNLARTAVARAEAELRATAATLAGRLARLQILLAMPAPIAIDGSLRDVPTLVADEWIARVAESPEVRDVDAQLAEADAELRLARTLRWPDLGVRASYAREEGDRIVMAGLGLTLPLFHRGREAHALANARIARLQLERETRVRAIESEIRAAAASHAALRNAVAEYERTVLPLVDENEQLAMESYEAGQTGLGDLLLVRREGLDARRAFLDLLVETRLAEVELRVQAGAWK